MAFIVTFLGKGGTGRTTVAIASAFKLASLGSRVLLVGLDPGPALGLLLGTAPSAEPGEIATNLWAVQLQNTALLENSWEDFKKLEAQYLRSPTLKNIYGQELAILPGIDSFLALNALRKYYQSGKYDAIVFDGQDSSTTLTTLGTPDILGWYFRRFKDVLSDSDVIKTISPFVQPIASALLNVALTSDNLGADSANKANDFLDEGKTTVSDPTKFAAYLVTTSDAIAIANARYLWGSAQQVGLTVGGVLLNQGKSSDNIEGEFPSLEVNILPKREGNDWKSLVAALPDFQKAKNAPKPLEIDTINRQVKVFLPGFDKKQVKLTQYGTEITIEAGDRRRNILLPPPLNGQPVKGAKFQDSYLIISL
jgi:arsenite-transporting ATPase